MEHCKLLFFLILFPHQILAVTCNFFRQRRDGVARSMDTCTGDYCYTYTISVLKIGYDQGCVTGIILPTQCWTDRSGTLCVCNTDNCNTPENREVGELQSRVKCVNDFRMYDPLFGGTSSQDYNNYNLHYGSTTCDVYGKMKHLGTWAQDGEQYRGEPLRESGSFRIFTGTHYYAFKRGLERERGDFTLFYYGGLFLSNHGEHGVSWFGRCRTDKCNNWSEYSLDPLLTGIKCKASEFTYPIDKPQKLGTCEGQMCAVMTSHVKGNNTFQSHFCFSQNSEKAEYPILVGYYANMNVVNFAVQDFLLCAEENCNVDVPTAQASIKKYQKAHKEEYPPKRNPLYVQ